MRLLIIEDNDGMRELLRQLLADYFDEIIEARDGEEGLRLYEELRPTMVVLDNVMPGMDGFETARRLIETDSKAHVIMVTDFDDIPFRQAAMKAGIRGFFGKTNLMHLRSYVHFLQHPPTSRDS
jgi:DNA-binding NarL/FixJ family response regulator